MKIVLVGYGKMGKAIERIAIERGHEVVLRITRENKDLLDKGEISSADAVIEFTSPEVAFDNVAACLKAGVPVISGSTGWNHQLPEAEKICREYDTAFLQSSNFSIGVNIFFEINALLARIMNHYPDYEVELEETHHIHKKDAPSGTAISLAERMLAHLDRKNNWTGTQPKDKKELSILSYRRDEVPGTHKVTYRSSIDDIELVHTAHNRDGFALGAVIAAEFIKGKRGVFSMKDILGF